ncbi:MAG TPA: DUF2442 domain-containing protein [Thermoanaerobaculia bacterium]|jgi:hypothetical protein|nr:DUF2442 domain-containing protein [Thermoanaerobaculia bacterium]
MFKPVDVKALPGYKIWVRFADGTEGQADLSHLANRGVFALWQDDAAFQKVHVGPQGQIAWNEEVEICPDSIYLRLTGKRPEEVFPNLTRVSASA